MHRLARYLWSPSHNRVQVSVAAPVHVVTAAIRLGLDGNHEFLGSVSAHGFKVWRGRRHAHSRNTFAPIFYATITPMEDGSYVSGHFQLNPVMRLFLIVWFSGSTFLALAILISGLLRTGPETVAIDALPYLVPAILPLIGWAILLWQQRKGRTDEEAIVRWLENTLKQVTTGQ